MIDTGLKRAIERTLRSQLLPQTFAWGEAFEHWVILELIKGASYKRLDWKFHYLRTKDDVEIDLVIERPGERKLLIEIKSKTKVTESDAKSLETLGVDLDRKSERVLLSCDKLDRTFGGTRAMHWEDAIRLWFQ